MIPSNWRACLSERIGKEQAGHLWRQEHITILVQGVAEESLCSFCLLAELRTMRSRESRSLRASDCGSLSITLWQVKYLFRNVVQTHLPADRCQTRDDDLPEESLDVISGKS
jgi:hypothetical protein